MAMRQTKAQLQAELHALKMENSTLRTQIDALRAEAADLRAGMQHWYEKACEQQQDGGALAEELIAEKEKTRYPHIDRIGRRYRVESLDGREIKCFQPS